MNRIDQTLNLPPVLHALAEDMQDLTVHGEEWEIMKKAAIAAQIVYRAARVLQIVVPRSELNLIVNGFDIVQISLCALNNRNLSLEDIAYVLIDLVSLNQESSTKLSLLGLASSVWTLFSSVRLTVHIAQARQVRPLTILDLQREIGIQPAVSRMISSDLIKIYREKLRVEPNADLLLIPQELKKDPELAVWECPFTHQPIRFPSIIRKGKQLLVCEQGEEKDAEVIDKLYLPLARRIEDRLGELRQKALKDKIHVPTKRQEMGIKLGRAFLEVYGEFSLNLEEEARKLERTPASSPKVKMALNTAGLALRGTREITKAVWFCGALIHGIVNVCVLGTPQRKVERDLDLLARKYLHS
jgi:hypothetical protein